MRSFLKDSRRPYTQYTHCATKKKEKKNREKDSNWERNEWSRDRRKKKHTNRNSEKWQSRLLAQFKSMNVRNNEISYSITVIFFFFVWKKNSFTIFWQWILIANNTAYDVDFLIFFFFSFGFLFSFHFFSGFFFFLGSFRVGKWSWKKKIVT